MPSLNTGNAILSNAIAVDSSYNVGIGGAASGSFKLQVTGTTNLTGALTGTSAALTSTLSAMATNIQFNLDGTFGANYYTMGFGGVSNGFNRIAGGTGTTDGLYITSATGRDIAFRTNGSGTTSMLITSGGLVGIQNLNPSAFVNSSGFGNLVVGGGSGETGITIYSGTTGSSGLMFADATTGSGAYTGYIVYRHATDKMEIATGGGTPRLTIESTGAATFTSSVTADYLTSNGGGQINTTTSPLVFFNSGGGGNAKRFGLNMTNLDGFKIYSLNDNGTTRKDNIIFANIDGNVGIGTTTTTNGLLSLRADTSNTVALVFQPTTSAAPSSISNFLGSNQTFTVIGSNAYVTNAGNIARFNTNYAGCYIAFDEGEINIGAGVNGATPSQKMRISSNGCVSINNPSDKSEPLSVQGFVGNWTAFFQANTTASNSYGPLVYGGTNTSDWALYVASAAGTPYFRVRGDGSTFVAGSLSKGSGSFRIDHPLESMSETHELVHSFIEGPQADLIYRGKLTLVNGKAQANIDEVSTMTNGTFESLCREVQCFTTNESGWDLIKGKVIGNIIYIESQNVNSTDEISWMVIGERKDKHMIDTGWTDENGKVIVEPFKIHEPENLPNNKQ
jgi:hypothetical protein